MKQTIEYIRSELHGLYPHQEIEQFIALIFQNLCGYSKADLIIYKNKQISDSLALQIRRFAQRLKHYEPIQYILGSTSFLDFEFHVRPGVLIPRPETEELVERIYNENHQLGLRILDIGTGSGCIAISLSRLLPESDVSAIDISEEALAIAQENARLNNAHINFLQTDILHYQSDSQLLNFDIIVSNPPYVCQSEEADMSPNVLDFEPHTALFVPDTDPLLFYRHIAQLSKTMLAPKGRLYFEINERFGQATREMLEQMGYQHIEIIRDLQGKDRIAKAIHI